MLPITFLINDIKNVIKNMQMYTVQINSYRPSGRLPRSSLGTLKRLPSPAMIGTSITAKKYSKASFLDLFKRLTINLTTEMPYERTVIKVTHDETLVYGPV